MSPEAISLFLNVVTIFVLAIFVGFEVISKVPSLLHTPLMSGSNAISGITIVGSILAVGLVNDVKDARVHTIVLVIALCALAFATINVVGGFVVTHRMLEKFRSGRTRSGGARSGGAGDQGTPGAPGTGAPRAAGSGAAAGGSGGAPAATGLRSTGDAGAGR